MPVLKRTLTTVLALGDAFYTGQGLGVEEGATLFVIDWFYDYVE